MTLPELYAPSGLLACRDVEALIDFSGGDPRNVSMAQLQIKGVTALYNILCQQCFAYLADEVGTGKTYQALGLAALTWFLKLDAHVPFIAPRENVQNGWPQEYERFFRHNYRPSAGGDDLADTLGSRNPRGEPVKINNLREWLFLLGSSTQGAAILRHTRACCRIIGYSSMQPRDA